MTYSVIVRDPNSWNASTGIHQELNNCGHKHRTLAAAQKCINKLTESRCLCGHTAKNYCPRCHTPHNSWAAAWWLAAIEEN